MRFGSILTIYPNPVNDFLYLEDMANDFEVQLMDQLGRVVISVSSTSGASKVIDLSGIRTGLYMVQIKTDQSIHTRLILKR
ncbi:MAG: T9SS type A sorting domain-containing protein [Bacteroidetes bacterium]|nr:T9SS type A sorting domain-containing protein [Bacteroidota bacterium]